MVLGLDGQRKPRARRTEPLPEAISDQDKQGLEAAPHWLPEVAKGYWERWAPQAIAERTLTPATAAGFLELCRRAAYVTAIEDTIERLGPGTQDALPYVNTYDRMAKGLHSMQKDFKLSAFGKPATSDRPKPAANPWADVAAK